MYKDNLILATGPRHPRGEWRVRVAVRWPSNKPYCTAVSFDFEHSMPNALFEEVQASVASAVDDFLAQNEARLKQKRDRETIERMQRDPRAARSLTNS
jgi:hypothetical protein